MITPHPMADMQVGQARRGIRTQAHCMPHTLCPDGHMKAILCIYHYATCMQAMVYHHGHQHIDYSCMAHQMHARNTEAMVCATASWYAWVRW